MLGAAEQNAISKLRDLCKIWQEEFDGDITLLDELFNGAANFDELVTQEDIDETPALAAMGFQKQTILDAIYVLKLAKTQMDLNRQAVAVMAIVP